MNLYVLDTDTLQLLQDENPTVVGRVRAMAQSELAIAVVTVEEQLSGWYTQLRQATAFAEGDLVRSTNDMYKEYGVGRVQKVRGEYVKVEFNPSVFMEPPYRSENKILLLSEIEKVDTPLDRAARGEWEPAWRFELKMLAARLLTGNKGGQLSNARTEILPHQIFTAHRVISSPQRRFLLADEKATHFGVEPVPFFATARRHLEQNPSLWSWEDDVEFLGMSWVEFR